MQSVENNGQTIGIINFLQVISIYKKMIFLITTTAFVAAIVFTLVATKIYSSTAKILPPQQEQSLLAGFLGQMGSGMAGMAGNLFGGSTSSDLFVGILETDPVSDAIINQFKLMDAFKAQFRIDAYRQLSKATQFEADRKTGIISITVEDKDPVRAAAMANAYVVELSKLLVSMNSSSANQDLVFYQERLAQAREDLAKTEDALKRFQTLNKTVGLEKQTEASIMGIAELRAQLATLEVQLSGKRRQFTDSTQDVKNLNTTIANLKGQIARLEGAGNGSAAIPAVGAVPAIGQEYVRLMREYKTKEALVELLTKQYEFNRLNMSKNNLNIQMIQKAISPDKRIKPKRAKIVVFATFCAFFSSIIAAFALESIRRMPDLEKMKWENLVRSLLPSK